MTMKDSSLFWVFTLLFSGAVAENVAFYIPTIMFFGHAVGTFTIFLVLFVLLVGIAIVLRMAYSKLVAKLATDVKNQLNL
jgi:hypothetical protein